MAKKFDEISPLLEEFILKQKIFFVGTARSTGTVNLSPKGMDSLRVLGPNKVIWLNLTGSGNETAAHIMENDRMTIMFCAFEGNPLILRLYGKAKVYHQRDKEYQEYIANFPET
ncbi:MAG: pyridoxamine 5'-phosphate oxidase family protein, partial [Bacteroidetes bacterium]|nr:pyridoxamine 5'-phosphate oxidase family protein [Bacteroidota bacterium]